MGIPARVSLITLGVADLARSTAFYEALGWERSASSSDEITFFKAAGGQLALYGQDELAADANVSPAAVGGFRGVAVAINLDTAEDVDAALAVAAQAGATLLKAAARAEWGGYSGYFADPDGHAWEVAWNPFFPIGQDGRPTLP